MDYPPLSLAVSLSLSHTHNEKEIKLINKEFFWESG